MARNFFSDLVAGAAKASDRLPAVAQARLGVQQRERMAVYEQSQDRLKAEQDRLDRILGIAKEGGTPSPAAMRALVDGGYITGPEDLEPVIEGPKQLVDTPSGASALFNPRTGNVDVMEGEHLGVQPDYEFNFNDDTGQTVRTERRTGEQDLLEAPKGYKTKALLDEEDRLRAERAGELSPLDERWEDVRAPIFAKVMEQKINPLTALSNLHFEYEQVYGEAPAPERKMRWERQAMESLIDYVGGELTEKQKNEIGTAFHIEESATRMLRGMQDPQIRERLNQWGQHKQDFQRWVMRWNANGSDPTLDGTWTDEEIEAFGKVEQFLTSIGLTQDLIVRMRSGAAVPPDEAARFARMLGNAMESPEALEARMIQMRKEHRSQRANLWAGAFERVLQGRPMPPGASSFLQTMRAEPGLPAAPGQAGTPRQAAEVKVALMQDELPGDDPFGPYATTGTKLGRYEDLLRAVDPETGEIDPALAEEFNWLQGELQRAGILPGGPDEVSETEPEELQDPPKGSLFR